MSQIERSNQRGKFSDSELRSKVTESNQFWQSPTGQKRKTQLDIESRNRKASPPRFPQAKGLKASITGGEARTNHCKNILARIERNTPKI